MCILRAVNPLRASLGWACTQRVGKNPTQVSICWAPAESLGSDLVILVWKEGSITKGCFEEGRKMETTTCGPAERAEDFMLGQGKSGLGSKGVSIFSYEGEISLSHKSTHWGWSSSFMDQNSLRVYLSELTKQMKANVMVNLHY